MTKNEYIDQFVELIRKASTELPLDVRAALEDARRVEARDSPAAAALETILDNVELASQLSAPICQDTGTPVIWLRHPQTTSSRWLEECLREAVQSATSKSYLRPNAVDTVSGSNTGTGTGRAIPYVHFQEWDDDAIEARLMLKGGGCENVGAQYKLPDSRLGAGRDLDGVRRVVLDGVVEAQGKGCAPGVLGICIGGDRASGFAESKCQLLRALDDRNSDANLAELEARLLRQANELGIGPMGFGGRTTVLGIKIGILDRLPASYFVSISYMCWADRRAALRLGPQGEVTWLN